MKVVIRERYLNQIRPHYDIDIIKVLIGIRRSGKSELVKQIIGDLSNSGINSNQIIYINFEDMRNEELLDYKELNKHLIRSLDKTYKTYIFLDEIQYVFNFEKVISSLKASENVSIFITGSSSSIVSGELATLIGGRYVSFTIQPLSFDEFYSLNEFNQTSNKEEALNTYLKWGGLPQVYQYKDENGIIAYLNDVYDSIVIKDILNRTEKKNYNLLKKVIEYLFDNSGKIFSTNTVYEELFNIDRSIQNDSVSEAVRLIIEANVVSECKRYDLKGKKILSRLEKYYISDLGLKSVVNKRNDDFGFNIETVIFNELISRGYQCFVGKTYKGEVDFVVFNGTKKCFIQVAYLLATDEVIEREFGAFKPIKDQSPKFVLSMDKFDFTRDGITHINIIDFLLFKKDIFFT